MGLEYLGLVAAEELGVVRGHLTWLLGKRGHGEQTTYEWSGPFSHAQLRMALAAAGSVQELEALVRAVLQET